MGKENKLILLNINNLSFSYEQKSILQNFNLELYKGEILGLSGENGCGKSTVLKLVAGYMDGYTGDIIFSSDELLSDIAAVIDIPSIYEDMSVKDNLKMMSVLKEITWDENLADILGLGKYMNKKASKLSFGNKQKLALCMTINSNTRLALLDEPFNGLDIRSKAVLTDYLKKRAKDGMGIIITSHIKGDLEQLCDRIVEMG